jgi:hypothetical protein
MEWSQGYQEINTRQRTSYTYLHEHNTKGFFLGYALEESTSGSLVLPGKPRDKRKRPERHAEQSKRVEERRVFLKKETSIIQSAQICSAATSSNCNLESVSSRNQRIRYRHESCCLHSTHSDICMHTKLMYGHPSVEFLLKFS